MSRIAVAVVWICALLSSASHAMDSASAAYLAARDKAIAEINSSHLSDAELDQKNKEALQQLQGMMQGIVGPIHLAGFPTNGTYSVETLFQELGFGGLDGIAVNSFDGKARAVVTTVPLLQVWLRDTPDLLKHPPKRGTADFGEAFASEDFHSMAVGDDDVHFYKYAELPVFQGVGLARAMLYVPAQDDPAPASPEGVLVAVMKGDKVVLFRKLLVAPAIPECAAAFAEDSKKALAREAAYAAARARNDPSASDVDWYGQASNAFIRCYARRLPGTAAYPALVREAQTLVDLVN
ncbi:hypothetical protein ACXU4B_10215 [Dyella soli]|uniref:Uncharacterized protein n=1 Tax=Dyella soli TaxID=522319 RepID=A0A4R0YXY8_9GAMM|nr:hypothetical protein [Dyella soli]TCI11300.1 hypothetical protein EZM97_21105 [Dyella soli]